MKYYILILFATTIIISCNTNTTSPENLNLPPGTHTRHQIDFLNGNIPLPNKYKEVSYVKLENELIKADTDSITLVNYYSLVEKIEQNGNYALFADTTHYSNSILILLGEYINFDKRASSIFLGMYEEDLLQTYQSRNIPIRRLHHSFITAGSSKILKIRYEIGLAYLNQYLITSQNKSFVFTAWNNDPLGFDTEIKGMRFE